MLKNILLGINVCILKESLLFDGVSKLVKYKYIHIQSIVNIGSMFVVIQVSDNLYESTTSLLWI